MTKSKPDYSWLIFLFLFTVFVASLWTGVGVMLGKKSEAVESTSISVMDTWHYGQPVADQLLTGCWIYEDGARLYRDFVLTAYGTYVEVVPVGFPPESAMQLSQPTCWTFTPKGRIE